MKKIYIMCDEFTFLLRKSVAKAINKGYDIHILWEEISMKGNFLKVLATGTLAASMLVGCSSGGAAKESVTLNDGDTVTIGLNYELSGDTATYGQAMTKGSKLAIKQYNENEESKYTAEYVEMDNKGDSAESNSIATKLMTEDDVVFQVGPATSGDSTATYPVADENHVPVLSPAVTQNGGMLKDDGTPYEYAWRMCFEDSAQASAMAVFANKDLGKKKAVVYSDSTSDYAKGLAADFVTKFEELGGEVVAQESFATKDTDFNAALSKIKGLDFDVLYVPGYYNESGLIIKQARDAGITQTILGPDGMDSPKLAELAGTDNLNDVYFTTAYTTVDASEELLAFIDAYEAEYGEQPDMFSVLAYDATNLGLQALEEAGATRDKLNEAIKNIEFDGLTGSFKFDEEHTPLKEVLVVELQNGEQVNPVNVDPNEE